MKKKLVLLVFSILLPLFSAPIELLHNGGFEQTGNKRPHDHSPFIGWRVNNAGDIKISQEAYSGSNALEFNYVPHSWGNNMFYSYNNAVHVQGPGQPARPGGRYRFSMWVKGKGTIQFQLLLHARKNWRFIRSASSPAYILSDKYQNVRFDYTVEDKETVLLQTGLCLWPGSKAIVDNISMTYNPDDNSLKDPGFPLPKKISGKLQSGLFAGPVLSQAPVIDGILQPGEYRDFTGINSLFPWSQPLLLPIRNEYFLGSDGNRLFFAARMEISPDGLIDRTRKNARNQWDSMEILIAPNQIHPIPTVYQAIMDFQGVLDSYKCTNWRDNQAVKISHDLWTCRSSRQGNDWHFECSVSLKALGLQASDLNKGIRIRPCRNWSNLSCGFRQSEINSTGGFFTNPATMPVFRFGRNIPAIQHRSFINAAGDPQLAVHFRNPGGHAVKLSCNLEVEPQFSQHSRRQTIVNLAPGQEKEVVLTPVNGATESALGRISITAENGTMLYFREFNFQNQQNREPFLAADKNPVFFDFAYLPSNNALAAEIDFTMGQPAEDIAKIKNITLEVRPKDSEQILAARTIPVLRKGFARLDSWLLKNPLPDGEYIFSANFNGSRLKPVEGTFLRRKFIWENNRIGLSDRLLPGFTPIRIQNRTMDTVLSSHQFNALGLFNQITADGAEILAAPMRLDYITADGRRGSAAETVFQWQKQSPTRCLGSFRCQLDGKTAAGTVFCEFDGMVTWKFTPPAGLKLRSLKLVIPLKNDAVPLMYSMSDGSRHHYAGPTPGGEGLIWKGSEAHRLDIPAPFVSYVWLGNDERGFSVTASNDKNWSVGKNAETQELIRRGNTVNLVYSLVSKPTAFSSAPGEIKLFFQATPVKRRLKDWRLLTFNTTALSGKKHNLAFLGTGYYWGAETGAQDVFPKDRDMTVLDKLKETRDTGKIDRDFFNRWFDSYDKMFATTDNAVELEAMKKSYRCMFGYPLPYLAHSQPETIVFYTNPRGMRFGIPEGKVFLNEWSRERFPKRAWGHGDGDSYLADPCRTYQDFSMWYFKEMSRHFLDVVYLDCVFLSANFNLIQSDAFRDDQGVIHPDCGFLNMREQVRRSSMMMHEQNRKVLTMVHMTSTAAVGIMSPAYTHYTWEYYASVKPFQERMTREMIRIMDTGIHSGTVPFAMLLVEKGTKAEQDWATRTGIGVALTHDIRLWTYSGLYHNVMKKMLDFGFGQENIPVYNYWQKNYPLTIRGIDSSSIAVRSGSKVLVVVSDWKQGGTASVTLAPSLGLSGSLTAVDLENNQPLKVSGRTVTFPIKQYDFKIFQVTGNREQ